MSDPVTNEQNLPAGMQERAAAAGQQPYVPPSQEVPEHLRRAPAAPVEQEAQPVNPMLSRVSQQAPAPVPTQHLEPKLEQPALLTPEPKQAAKATGTISDLVGDLGTDPYAKPSITYIETLCTKGEVDLGRAFNNAVEHGDASLIDSAYLNEKLGADAAAVIAQATSLFEYSASQAEKTMADVYEAAGGEEVLRQAVPYFNKSADAAEKEEVEYLLNSGNKALMARAAKRIVQYSQSAGMTYSPNGQPLGSPSSEKGLSKADYIAAISKQNISPEAYNGLRNQRKLGKQQGL